MESFVSLNLTNNNILFKLVISSEKNFQIDSFYLS